MEETRDLLVARINTVMDTNYADKRDQATYVASLSAAVRDLTEAIKVDEERRPKSGLAAPAEPKKAGK